MLYDFIVSICVCQMQINLLTYLLTNLSLCVSVTEYLTNVLEDLGLEATDNMTTLVELLQASPEQYLELADQSPQRLASAVAALRCLKLTE